MKRFSFFQILVGLLVSVLFLVLLAQRIELSALKTEIGNITPIWLLFAVLFLGLDYALRIKRWQLLLSVSNPAIEYRQCASPLLASYALNNLMPFRIGDAFRVVAIQSASDVALGRITVTLIFERILDFVCLILVLLVSSSVLSMSNRAIFGTDYLSRLLENSSDYFVPGMLILIAGIVVIYVLWRRVGAFDQFLVDIATGVREFNRPSLWISLLSYSMAVWILEGMVFLATAISLTNSFPVLANWYALGVGSLSTLLPSAPGYVGTFDYFTSLAYVQAGFAEEAAIAIAIAVHLVLWIPITMVGCILLVWILPESYRHTIRQLKSTN